MPPIPKNKARVIFTLLILALVMKKVAEETDIETENALVQQCTMLMDSLLMDMPPSTREAVIEKVQDARVKFSKKSGSCDAGSALIGAMRVVVGPTFKSKLGTHFDFVRQTLRKNLHAIESSLPRNEAAIDKFALQFKSSILSL